METLRKTRFRPVGIAVLIGSLVSSPTSVLAGTPSAVNSDSVVVQKVDLTTGDTRFYAVPSEKLLNENGEVKIPRDQLDTVVTAGTNVPADQIKRWKNVHQAELARGIPATISSADGSTTPLKNFSQVTNEIIRLSPDGKVAKQLKWAIEHESDLTRGQQSWFWAGFFLGGLTFLGLSYAFAPRYYYPTYYYPTYSYYGFYRPYWYW